METKTKIFIAAGVLLLIGGGAAIYFYIRKKQADAEAEKERLNAELNAMQLEALNQAAKDEAEAAALAALFPSEAIIGGAQVNAGGNANNAMSGGTGTAVAADSTAGKQLIELQKALLAQNETTRNQAKARAGITATSIFAGVDPTAKDKFKQALEIRTGWNGQDATFPMPTRYTNIESFEKLLMLNDMITKPANNGAPAPARFTGFSQQMRRASTAGRVFDLPELNYSFFTADGLMLPNPPPPPGTPTPTATKLMFGDGSADRPFPGSLYFENSANNGRPVDLRTLQKIQVRGKVYPVLNGIVQWEASEVSPTNTEAPPPPAMSQWNGTGDANKALPFVRNFAAAAVALDQSLENIAKEILLQQNRIFYAN